MRVLPIGKQSLGAILLPIAVPMLIAAALQIPIKTLLLGLVKPLMCGRRKAFADSGGLAGGGALEILLEKEIQEGSDDRDRSKLADVLPGG